MEHKLTLNHSGTLSDLIGWNTGKLLDNISLD